MRSVNSKKTRRNYEQGQSLVELAISFPVLLLLMIGTIDFGMAAYSYLIIRDAAQEGALYGSINPGNISEIENRVRFIAPIETEGLYFSPVDLTNKDIVKIKIKTSGEKCQGSIGGKFNSITVDINYKYHLIIPLAESIVGSNTISLDATATNVIVQPACN